MTEGFDKEKSGAGKILHFERDSAFYAKRGDAKRAQNDLVSAISMYMEALERSPHDYDTRLAAAEILTDMSRFNDSNKLLIPYMHEDEEFCKDAYCIVGFNMLGMGEYDGARGCFERFFELTDEVSERTDAILDALDYIESLELEQPVLKDAANVEYESRILEATKAFENDDFTRSESILKSLSAEYPQNTDILYRLALSCLCQNKIRECDEYISELIRMDENNWSALGMKLMCAKALNNELEMSRLSKKLEDCSSMVPEDLLRVNGALIEVGCLEGALKAALKLRKLLPYDTLSNHRLAVCYMGLKQFSKAADIYGFLLRIDRNDRIARFYHSYCIEAAVKPGRETFLIPSIVQYQLPFDVIMDDVKKLLDINRIGGAEQIAEKWENDDDFSAIVRWAFSLNEFNITHAMFAVLQLVSDSKAEHIVREVLSDIDIRDSVINEGLGTLKRMGAHEPFFAITGGRLLEGKVNIVDLSELHVPKSYRDIFIRIHKQANDLLNEEVMSVASSLAERFIMCSLGSFKPLSKEQSEALSAAIEFLACERCNVIVRDDLLERYGVTEKRLSNAIDRIIKAFVGETDDKGLDTDNGGDDE